MKDDMKLLGLQPELAIIRDMWRDIIIIGQMSDPRSRAEHEKIHVFKNKW